MVSAYIEMLFSRGGGIMTLPMNRGVFYGAKEAMGNCPPGWLFVPIGTVPSAEALERLVEDYKQELKYDQRVQREAQREAQRRG